MLDSKVLFLDLEGVCLEPPCIIVVSHGAAQRCKVGKGRSNVRVILQQIDSTAGKMTLSPVIQ